MLRKRRCWLVNYPIQWHPGFYAGMEMEFRAYQVSFDSEYQLTKGPLSIDLLIIKKLTDEVIDNEIGNLFRRHNIVEFKSPEDSLNIDPELFMASNERAINMT